MEKIKYFKAKESVEGTKIDLKQILKGVVCATVIALICLIVAAIMFTYTNISMSFVKIISNVIFYAGVFVGGVIASFKKKSCGWLHGAIAGLIYTLLIWVIRILSDVSGVQIQLPFVKIIFGIVLGALGGIVGVNIKTKSNKRR